MTTTVYPAEAYRAGAMSSCGNASMMLITQYQFPHTYDADRETLFAQSHDRIDYDHCERCFRRHTGGPDHQFEGWARRAEPVQVLALLSDLLGTDEKINWTGFRILGSVNWSNGHSVWTFQRFAKDPHSNTAVYDTENVPHLIIGSRHGERSA